MIYSMSLNMFGMAIDALLYWNIWWKRCKLNERTNRVCFWHNNVAQTTNVKIWIKMIAIKKNCTKYLATNAGVLQTREIFTNAFWAETWKVANSDDVNSLAILHQTKCRNGKKRQQNRLLLLKPHKRRENPTTSANTGHESIWTRR